MATGAIRRPRRRRRVPRPLHDAIRRGLAPAPGDRPASMAALLADLEAAVASVPADGPRRPPVRAAASERVCAPRRWRVVLGGAAAVGAGALFLATPLIHRSIEPLCTAAHRLDGIWDADVKARFAAASGPGAGRWASILRTIDTHAGEWIALRESACRTGSRVAEACLDQQLEQLRKIVADLDVGDPKGAEIAVSLLPRPSVCADPGALAPPRAAPQPGPPASASRSRRREARLSHGIGGS